MSSRKRLLVHLYWLATFLLFTAAIAMLLFYVPTEATMGPIQKIFYLHLPVAIGTLLACFACFVASIGYLVQRTSEWDDFAAAAGRVAVQLCSVVLLTGMIWGKSAWGQWWTWSPRLTFVLVLWLLYVIHLMVRLSVESRERRATLSAVYAIIAFLDVPLVYLSARLMPDIHPASIQLAPPMKLTLLAWFVPVLMLTAGLIVAKFVINVNERARENLVDEQAETDAAVPKPMRRAYLPTVGGVA
jgi:heme exporter protein C